MQSSRGLLSFPKLLGNTVMPNFVNATKKKKPQNRDGKGY